LTGPDLRTGPLQVLSDSIARIQRAPTAESRVPAVGVGIFRCRGIEHSARRRFANWRGWSAQHHRLGCGQVAASFRNSPRQKLDRREKIAQFNLLENQYDIFFGNQHITGPQEMPQNLVADDKIPGRKLPTVKTTACNSRICFLQTGGQPSASLGRRLSAEVSPGRIHLCA
jgi:hypothetical protein